MRDQLVDSPTYEASLTQLEEVVADYQGSQEAFIDLCADVDLYWLVRLRIGSASTLVSRFVYRDHGPQSKDAIFASFRESSQCRQLYQGLYIFGG